MSLTRGQGLGLVGVAVGMGAVVVTRILLIHKDVIYGASRTAIADVVGGLLLSALLIAGARAVSGTDSVSRAGALVALAAATAGAVSVYAPATPTEAAAPACRGVPIAGARFLAQTTGDSLSAASSKPSGAADAKGSASAPAAGGGVAPGVNARSGPSTSYPQIDRFAGDCTLGFDGYCIGAPVADLVTDLPDTRWLRVHGRDGEFVSSAKVLSQSRESDLGATPDGSCAGAGGLPQPGAPAFTPTIGPGGQVDLAVVAHGAALVGYAVNEEGPTDGSYPYSPVGHPLTLDAKTPPFHGTWDAVATAVPVLPGGSGNVELAAATCLAADVPVMPPSVFQATFTSGALTALVPGRAASARDAELLAHTACSGPD